jgi:hypothetical protein
MGDKPQAGNRDGSEQLLMEMDAILDRIAGLLRILAEEIVVFDYFNEKYHRQDTKPEAS